MSWKDFHTQCRLLAVGKADLAQLATLKNGTANNILHALTKLGPVEQKSSAYLYGLLSFQMSVNTPLSKAISSYITLLFMVFCAISTLHLSVIWPSFDGFFAVFNSTEAYDLTTVTSLWPLILLMCGVLVFSCWLYRFAALRYCTSEQPLWSDVLIPAQAKTARQHLLALLEYPLRMHRLPTNNTEQILQQFISEPTILAAEIQQQWQQQQQIFRSSLTGRLTMLHTLSAVCIVAAVGLLLTISYQFLFNIGGMV